VYQNTFLLDRFWKQSSKIHPSGAGILSTIQTEKQKSERHLAVLNICNMCRIMHIQTHNLPQVLPLFLVILALDLLPVLE
jgi:hypothetical protein